MSGDHDKAWDEFWASNKGAGKGSGCLPEGWRGIDQVQRDVWRGFARKLKGGDRVLDLASGDGRVMAYLLSGRRALKITGIDQASRLPSPPRGTKLKGGVSMDALPMPDASFAAITSQFGLEYGDLAKTAAEMWRVARPGALVGIMSHREDGPIVAHNLRRREQILWATEEQDLPAMALHSLQLRAAGIATIPQTIAEAPEKGARAFGRGSAAWEIAEAIRQTLHYGRNDRADAVANLIREIAAQARNELGRIASLADAAKNAALGERIAAALGGAGFELQSREQLRDGAEQAPFADFSVFRKPD